jgi:hypothetical protein
MSFEGKISKVDMPKNENEINEKVAKTKAYRVGSSDFDKIFENCSASCSFWIGKRYIRLF